jgi:hypothetical protein
LNCRYCGDVIPEERTQGGYDYCVKQECSEQGLRGLNVVAIHVNKSNDQYALREQLEIPEIAGGAHVDGGQYGIRHRSARRQPEVLTDGQRIERMRRRLEARLRDTTDVAERSRLIDAYNSQVRRMNIRYRHTGLYREDGRTSVKPRGALGTPASARPRRRPSPR